MFSRSTAAELTDIYISGYVYQRNGICDTTSTLSCPLTPRFDEDVIERFEENSSTSARRVTHEVGVDQHLIWDVLMAAAEIIRTSADFFRRMRRSLLQRYVACRNE